MFEANLLQPSQPLQPDSARADDALRVVTWSDLVAKLDAARDLRAALYAYHGDGEASFDPGCARHIAALCDGKPGVNLDDLGNGKGESSICCPGELAAGGDPRE